MLNQRDGVVVLSAAAGAFRELKDAALAVEPEDIEGTAAALQRALLMSPEERRGRAKILRRTVASHDISRWLEAQIGRPPRSPVGEAGRGRVPRRAGARGRPAGASGKRNALTVLEGFRLTLIDDCSRFLAASVLSEAHVRRCL